MKELEQRISVSGSESRNLELSLWTTATNARHGGRFVGEVVLTYADGSKEKWSVPPPARKPGWKQRSVAIHPAGEFVRAVVTLGYRNPAGGTVWFDDVSLTACAPGSCPDASAGEALE